MSIIVEIKKLRDNYRNIDFGYVGVDLNTKEVHHYYEDINRNITEFDINNLADEQFFLKEYLHNCIYKRQINEKIPNDILDLTKKIIEKHIIYNKFKAFPVNMLENSSRTLSINYENNNTLFRNYKFSGKYIPIKNSIQIPINESKWKKYNENDKEELSQTILHEIGHMKATKYKLDIRNKQIQLISGFYKTTILIEPIQLKNSDISLKYVDVKNNYENEIDKIIEEIMNDYDCKLINPSYITTYPNIGHILNKLCDNSLEIARYQENGIDTLNYYLKSIIKSNYLIDELYENIIESTESQIHGYNKNTKKLIKTLKKYEEKKLLKSNN